MPFLPGSLLLIPGCATVSAPREEIHETRVELSTPIESEPLQSTELSTALSYFGLALRHELQSEIPRAMEAYGKAIEADPDNDALYRMVSQRLLSNDREEQAFELMETLLERHPENVHTLRWLARLHLKNERPEEALPLLRRAARQHPPKESVYLMALQLELQNGNIEQAIEWAGLGREHADTSSRLTRVLIELLGAQAKQAPDLASSLDVEQRADDLLAQAIRDYPEESSFLLKRAEQRGEAGDLEAALASYHKADGRENASPEFRTRILVHFIRTLGGDSEAIGQVKFFLEEQEEPDALSLYLLGQLHEVSGQPVEALATFQRAAELAPEDSAIRRKLALLYFQNDQPGRASSQLAEVLSERPDDLDLRMLAGQLKLAVGDFETAARHFQHVLLLSRQGVNIPNLPEVEARRSMALLALGRGEDAVDAMETAVRALPESLELIWAHQMRLAIRERDTDLEKAEAREQIMLDALYDLSDRLPDDPRVETYIGTTYNFRQRHSEAVEAFERAAALAEDKENASVWLTPEFFFDWGNALERSGRIEEAVRTFNKVLTLEPNHHQTLNYLAYMWAERDEQLEKALDYVQRALALDPGNGSYIDTLGWVYYQQGKFEEALRELEKAAAAEPMEPVIIEHLGDVMLKLDRPVEAAGYYRIALELDSGDRESIVRESLTKAEAAIADDLERP